MLSDCEGWKGRSHFPTLLVFCLTTLLNVQWLSQAWKQGTVLSSAQMNGGKLTKHPFSPSTASQIASLGTSTAHRLLLRILPEILRWGERPPASLLNGFRENMFLKEGIVSAWKWMSGKGEVVPVQSTGRRQDCAETRENLGPVNSCTAVSECWPSILGGVGRRRSWRSFSAA